MEEVRPGYYRVAGMETMSVIRAVLTEEEFRGFIGRRKKPANFFE